MNITVYLPDEIGERAKAELAGRLSQMLQQAVRDELHRMDALKTATADAVEYELALQDEKEGYGYTGRITGRVLGTCQDGAVYLTDDERVIIHDAQKGKYWVIPSDDEDELEEALGPILSEGDYVAAMATLGYSAKVDI